MSSLPSIHAPLFKAFLIMLSSMYGCAMAASGPSEDSTTAASAPEQTREHFDVWEIRILGNSVLPIEQIEAEMYPFLGPQRSIEDVEKARVTLEKRYKDSGYGTVFVDIPEQDVVDGIVRLRVTEGKLDRVRITGARYFLNRRLRAELPVLKRDSVLPLPSFQEQLSSVNRRSPDRSVTPILRAGREQGKVDLELKVEDKLPLHAGVEVNDRYTANTSETRVNATLSYDNLWQRFHSLAFQYQTAPEEPEQARVIAGTYVAPIQSTGHIVAAFAVDTDSEFTTLGAEFSELGVIGKGNIYGLRYIVPLQESAGYFHNITFGGDYKDFDEMILQEDGTPAETPISYANWSAVYAGTARSERAITSFDVGINFGIRGLANSSEEFAFKRFSGTPNKGDPGYFYLTASAQHERPLTRWFTLFGRLNGQYSPHALISNEQFSIGGAESVRGYLESEELGDYGAAGSLEMRVPLLGRWMQDKLRQFYVFGFFDAGIVAIQHPLDSQELKTDLSSWGAGVRLTGFGGLEAGIDWAYPLEASGNVDAGDSRIHFRVRYGF